jgi:hypothetical protein
MSATTDYETRKETKMRLKNVDYDAYEQWKSRIQALAPAYVNCPDCNGSGEGTCPHCGNDADCDTCGGDGLVSPGEILTPEFYRRVVMFEKEKLEHWLKGDPIAVSGKGRLIESRNPLNEFIQELQPTSSLSSLSVAPKIVIHLPLTD